MANILITGGSGFIGSVLSRRCCSEGHKVYITSKPDENKCQHCEIISDNFHEIPWDTLPKIDVLFHLASCTDTMIHDERYMLEVNYEWAIQLFQEAVAHDVRDIVYSSSAATYGKNQVIAGQVIPFKETDELKPLNIYGESKAMLDMDANFILAHIVGLRYSNVYGGKPEAHKGRCASMVWQLLNKIRAGESPTLFKWGEQSRDFVHVSDVVDANLLAWKSKENGVFNIGAGRMWSFNQIVEYIQEILGTNLSVNYVDNYIQQYYQDYNAINIDRASKYLNYKPKYDLKSGLQEIIKSSS